ncbi:MAG: clostripain-related cysteine peptidase [Elusimicrobia bacterium]|nr:clostripain-related cysteine peptidase [Elusimicrobiota bacterium]
MKKILMFQVALSLFLLNNANSEDTAFNFNASPSLSEIIKETSQMSEFQNAVKFSSSKESKNIKPWTIMVFINGKNDLADFAAKDVNEMEEVGSQKNFNIVVEIGKIEYFDPVYPHYPDYDYDDPDNHYEPQEPNNPYGPGIHPHWPLDEPSYLNKSKTMPNKPNKADTWTGMRRYYIEKDNDTGNITSPVLQELNADMGSWEHLAEFGLWAKTNFPAEKYMLIVWNHGDGWKTRNLNIDFNFDKGISSDDTTGNKISTVDLGKALKKMGGVNIYASDACLMQMVEVAYELKDWAPVIIGSEEIEPSNGWPYGKILAKLQSYSELRYDWIAKAVTKNYGEDYRLKQKAVTQSAIKARGLVYMKDMLNDWIQLIPSNEKKLIKEAMKETTRFGGANSKDLLHFLKLVSDKTQSSQFKNKALEIINYFISEILIDNVTVGDKYKNAYGLAAYLPVYGYDESYSNLAWAKDTNWDEFLRWVLSEEEAASAKK